MSRDSLLSYAAVAASGAVMFGLGCWTATLLRKKSKSINLPDQVSENSLRYDVEKAKNSQFSQDSLIQRTSSTRHLYENEVNSIHA